MAVETLLVRTMSDTVETDIQRVQVIANELLPRYGKPVLTLRAAEESRRRAVRFISHSFDLAG